MSVNRYNIKNIFFIKDEDVIIVFLKETNWDCKNYGIVYLCFDELKIKMRYIGFGNIENNLALSLKLIDTRYNSIGEIELKVKYDKANYFLER